MHQLTIISQRGDDQTKWNPDNKSEVLAAEAKFNELMSKKYSAFNMDIPNGERIKQFNPTIKETLMIPPIIGG